MGIIIKNSAITTIINMVGVGIGAISLLFIQAHFLSEQEIGAIKVLHSTALLIYPFVLVGLSSAIPRFFFHFEKDQKQYNQFISFTLVVPFLLLVVLIGLFYSLESYVYTHFLNSSPYLKKLMLVIPIMVGYFTFTALLENYLFTKTKIAVPSVLRNVLARLYLIAVIFLYYFDVFDFSSLLLSYSLLHLINLAIMFYLVKKRLNYSFTSPWTITGTPIFKKMATYCFYLILGTGGTVIVNQIDTLMTGGILQDLGAVGIYTIAFFIATLIEIPKRPLVQVAVPILSRSLGNNELDEVEMIYKKSSINLLIIGGVIFSLIWVNIDYLYQIMPNSEVYENGKYVVFFIGLSKMFDLALGINYEIIQYSKFYKWNLFLMPFLAVVAIGTNLYFIEAYGITGTAIATAISIFIYNLIRTALIYFKLNLHPFTVKHLATVVLIGIGVLVVKWVNTPDNPFLGIIINTAIFSVLFAVPAYFLRLSEDLNRIAEMLWKRIF
ncbi:oligosaccharide flippase family protein [bacterium SCSIO 12741]|nr:oligosaccharide flippase family protein [bacterium SCSIO 12741]